MPAYLQMSDRPRIGLAGWYGYGNVGDDLMLRLLVERVRPAAVFSSRAGSVGEIPIHHVGELPEWDERLDLLLIGGGGLLNQRWIAKLPLADLRLAYGFLSVGIPQARWLGGMEEILARARFVTLRDHLALRMFAETYPDVAAMWLPDPGFMLERLGLPKEARVVLNPRAIPKAWIREEDPDDAEDRQVALMRSLVERFSDRAEVLALGFEQSDAELLARLPCESRVVAESEAVDVIARSAIVVTARLHGGIVAATQGTPVALIDYQDKVRGLAPLVDATLHDLTGLDGIHDVVERALSEPAASDAPCARSVPAAYGALTRRVLGFMASS